MRRAQFLLLIVLISISCMLYELVLAQTSAIFLGGVLLNYSVTISIYLAALGAGSLFYAKLGPIHKVLWRTEILLSFAGTLAPFLVLVGEYSLRRALDPASYGFHLTLQALTYGFIALIGIGSGFELPILIQLGDESGLRSGAVLGLDYLGTFLAVCLFAWVGFERFGIFGTAALAGLGSGGGALLTAFLWPERHTKIWSAVALVLPLGLLCFLNLITDFASNRIYLGGGQ